MKNLAITAALPPWGSQSHLGGVLRQQKGGSLMGGVPRRQIGDSLLLMDSRHSNSVSFIQQENKSEMGGDGERKRKMLEETNISSLPDDILFFDILKRLTAHDIYNATMVVCRKWYKMIHTHDFIHTHIHSTCGFLIQNLDSYSISFMELRQNGQIEISKFSYMCRHRYWSSCNGLMLECYCKDYNELVIINPLTLKYVVLPPFITRTQEPYSLSALAYAPNSMVYKVVRTSYLEHGNSMSRKHCFILSVGIDNSWRLVDTQHLSLSASELFNSCPWVTGGFMHWTGGVMHWTPARRFVLTLDLETETVSQFALPLYEPRFLNCFLYFTTASYLSLLVIRSSFKWDVWEMKPKTGEWTKLPDIDLEAQKCAFLQLCCEQDSSFKADGCGCKLFPVGWLKYREVLVFIVMKEFKVRVFKHNQTRLRVVYNLRTQDFIWCEFEEPHYLPYLVHRNSLEWNC